MGSGVRKLRRTERALINETVLSNLTLSSWAAQVWEKELRGVSLHVQESTLAWCMKQHVEWRTFWNNLNNQSTVNPARAANILVHIYNDGAVKLQLESNNPPEIKNLFQMMRANGFSDMDALHTISFVFQEQTWSAKAAGAGFDCRQYVERAKRYVENVIAHPGLMRGRSAP